MITKLQLVLLGIVVFQGAGLSAMDKAPNSPRKVINSPRTPRNPLSYSQEARLSNSMVVGLKRSLEVSREEKQNVINFYYDSPCGAGRVKMHETSFYSHNVSLMAPWAPDYFPH